MLPTLSRLLLVTIFLQSVHVSAADWSFIRRVEGDAVVVTDMTPAGRLLPPHSPQNPIYFKGISLGNKFGSIPGDDEPTVKAMTDFATRLLRKQGFLGSPGDHQPPTQFLVMQWGYMSGNPVEVLDFLGYNPADDIAAPVNPNMLGMEVFRRGMRTREVETILDLSDEPIYAMSITAFDYASANTPKPVALWQTRIGFPATGQSMAEALPKMLNLAANQIGRPTEKPMLRDVDALQKGEVILGDMEVVGFGKDAEKKKK